jgi:hypothetical protein
MHASYQFSTGGAFFTSCLVACTVVDTRYELGKIFLGGLPNKEDSKDMDVNLKALTTLYHAAESAVSYGHRCVGRNQKNIFLFSVQATWTT